MRQIDLSELVGNTFVVVTRFGYKAKDALVADIMLPMYAAAEFDSSGYGKMALKVAEMGVKAGLGAGYYVTVDSYLFRLRWNDAIAERFNELWDNETGAFNMDAYNASDLFSLQFIGNERAWAKTKAGVFTDKSEDELIRLAAADAVDGVLAKFERKYDEFKTKTPLIVHETTDKKGRPTRTYAARIGTRDGLEGGEVFEVLEKKIVMKDSVERVSYVKKGELTVDKKNVWDNSYSTEAGAPSEEAKTGETLLVGKSKDAYYEGLLLRMNAMIDQVAAKMSEAERAAREAELARLEQEREASQRAFDNQMMLEKMRLEASSKAAESARSAAAEVSLSGINAWLFGKLK